jgi:hypothetical protein
MMRMRIPQLIQDKDEINIAPKTDDDQMMGRTDDNEPNVNQKKKGYGKVGKPINADIDWQPFIKNFESVPRENLLATLSASVLQTKMAFNTDIIKNYSDNSGRESFIKTATIQLMSTPEYQMC